MEPECGAGTPCLQRPDSSGRGSRRPKRVHCPARLRRFFHGLLTRAARNQFCSSGMAGSGPLPFGVSKTRSIFRSATEI